MSFRTDVHVAEIIAMDVTRRLVYGKSITGVYKVHWGTLWVVPGYELFCRQALSVNVEISNRGSPGYEFK